MTMTTLVVLIVYLGIIISVGFWAKRKTRNVKEFAVAGRNLAFFAAMCTIVASEWGGGVVMGVSEDAFAFGISSLAYPITLGLGLIILGLTLVRKYWHLDTITMPEFLKKRFSIRVEALASILMVISLTLVTASQVRAAAIIGQSLFSMPLVITSFIFVIIVCIYTSIGGLWAVAYNDTIQLIIGGIGIIVILGVALSRVGGVITLFKSLPASYLDPRPWGNWIWAFDYLASVTFVMLAVPELVQRIWACKSEKIAKNSLLIGGLVYWVFGIASMLLGLCAFILIPNIESGAVPSLILHLFPPFLGAVLVISLLAALLSTTDTMILVCSTIFVEDLYKRFIKPALPDKESLKVMRLMVFVFGGVILVWALLVPRILSLILYSMYAIIGFSTIYIFGNVWKKTSEIAAFWCLILTALAATIWHFGNFSYKYFLTTGIVAFLVSIISIVVLSYIFPRKQKKVETVTKREVLNDID